jgi:uncharacterized protein (TIGR02594 family)
MNFGTKLSKPAVGAIVVFWRGTPSSGSGHVGFVAGKDASGRLLVLGGNQGDMVSIKPGDTSRLVGYVWPSSDLSGVNYTLPILNSSGNPSEKES